jgi:hypothetical protein
MAIIVYVCTWDLGIDIFVNKNIDPTQFDAAKVDTTSDEWEQVFCEADYIEKTFGDDDTAIENWTDPEDNSIQGTKDDPRVIVIETAVKAANPDFIYASVDDCDLLLVYGPQLSDLVGINGPSAEVELDDTDAYIAYELVFNVA